MSIIKSLSVGNGDMFYIKHGSDNFTIIDCCMDDDTSQGIIDELKYESKSKSIIRFISTHPDEDHIHGLMELDNALNLKNFYCVQNKAIKDDPSEDFKHYCVLRDDVNKSFYVHKNCKRKWMNDSDKTQEDDHGSSGINFLWPNRGNKDFQEALVQAADGTAFNNISPIFTYEQNQGVKIMWMGDMEHDFQEKIKNQVAWQQIDILFAPHHGRDSGRVSSEILDKLNPHIIVIGEAPSDNIYYYNNRNTIKQNTAKNIVFDSRDGFVHVYFSAEEYQYDLSFLENRFEYNEKLGYYAGSFIPHNARGR